MDKFKYKDRGTEKFWLIVIITIFINLNILSIDNIFFENYLHIHYKYIFFLFIPIIMLIINFLFIKQERFLEYGFKESYKGYLLLFVLFITMIVLMALVKPIKH
jgi:magnesium-transporting ATPase (P-type)